MSLGHFGHFEHDPTGEASPTQQISFREEDFSFKKTDIQLRAISLLAKIPFKELDFSGRLELTQKLKYIPSPSNKEIWYTLTHRTSIIPYITKHTSGENEEIHVH
jgi:hypothetical protein